MKASLTRWTENSGEAVGSLISRIPDTQKIFLRQSNGAVNSDVVDGQTVGQDQVITDGNDTGAFGKCAPTSFFCAAITGIGVGTRDGLDLLQEDRRTSKSAKKMESLLTASPMNDEANAAIHAELAVLKKAAGGDRALTKAIGHVEQMVTSVLDRMVVKEDEEGPYMEMESNIPPASSDPTCAINTWSLTAHCQVRPGDIQEYLEQTNRSDTYRGGRKHMMDFYKDPSSMNQIELMEHLGPGIIAVGVDKALKEAGKDSGLLYGPGTAMVNAMVYNKPVQSGYKDLSSEIEAEPGTAGFKQAQKERRNQLIRLLGAASESGGSVSVSMGYNSDTGHVNYVQAWGTPQIDGVEIDAEDLARLHMNRGENSATSSAWNNDRVQTETINTEKMAEGLRAIRSQLASVGKKTVLKEIDELIALAETATDVLETICKRRTGGLGIEGTKQRYGWVPAQILDDPTYMKACREASSEVMAWTKKNLELVRDETADPENIVIMPSNTERDDSVSDNAGDQDRVGGGQIGEQARGSSNASDGSYFVPLDMLAADGMAKRTKPKATRAPQTRMTNSSCFRLWKWQYPKQLEFCRWALTKKIDAALIQTGWMRSGSSLSEQDRARNAWLRGHIVAMARIVDEGGIELDWSSEMDLNDLLNALHQIMSPTHRIVENLSELLGLVDEIEAMEEDRSGVPVSPPSVPEMNVGEQTAWLSRLCDAFVRAESATANRRVPQRSPTELSRWRTTTHSPLY